MASSSGLGGPSNHAMPGVSGLLQGSVALDVERHLPGNVEDPIETTRENRKERQDLKQVSNVVFAMTLGLS